ncbi:hypothetical protein ASPCAL08520 [Aspergillus calidoustus]|uniref:Uncharacterized protein n=1 Tax=Aspergillus calidoustus TaxID=454130 RepID=A0A0U5CQP4_ASPCI|nr:hypothetical protein ASPCAL08520 [Aspergillus calidoustus]
MVLWRREGAEECELVGEAMAPLVGNGILVGFAGQAVISLGLSLWVFFLTTHGNMDITHPEGSKERDIERKRLDFVSSILTIGCDIQLTLGIAYLITVFSQVQIMDTYHLHLVFDIVSFVAVSNTAALVCWRFCRVKIDGQQATDDDAETDAKTGPPTRRTRTRGGVPQRMSYWNSRYRATFLFIALYLALTILLCIRLNEWAPNTSPGRCYHSHLITSPGASHPGDDKIYVSITASWLIGVVLASVFAGVSRRRGILVLSSLHFPLHMYMAIALRQANQGRFEGETKHENEWDFGQTTAVVLLGGAVVELLSKGREYWSFERSVKRDGGLPDARYRSLGEAEEGVDFNDARLLDAHPGEEGRVSGEEKTVVDARAAN